jgi:hypothetical protein
MAADVSAMADMAEQGFIPDGGKALLTQLEKFPQLFELLSSGMHELAEFMSGQGGILEETGADMHEAADMAGSLFDSTSDIFLKVNEAAKFWTSD